MDEKISTSVGAMSKEQLDDAFKTNWEMILNSDDQDKMEVVELLRMIQDYSEKCRFFNVISALNIVMIQIARDMLKKDRENNDKKILTFNLDSLKK